jgi:hypothetical protein
MMDIDKMIEEMREDMFHQSFRSEGELSIEIETALDIFREKLTPTRYEVKAAELALASARTGKEDPSLEEVLQAVRDGWDE